MYFHEFFTIIIYSFIIYFIFSFYTKNPIKSAFSLDNNNNNITRVKCISAMPLSATKNAKYYLFSIQMEKCKIYAE